MRGVTNSSKATRSAGEMLIPALDSTRMVLYCCVQWMSGSRLYRGGRDSFTATIADKRGFIQQTAMVRLRNKVLAVRVAMIAGSAHPFANRGGIGTTNIFLFAIFCQSTFVSRFIKTIVFLERRAF